MADIKKLFELSGMGLYSRNGFVNHAPLVASYNVKKDDYAACEKKLQDKLVNDAMINFKRKAMGYFETKTYKSRDEMMQLIHDTKLYSDENSIEQTLESLIGQDLNKPVNDWHILWNGIRFNKLKDPKNEKSYVIEAYIYNYPVRYNF